MRNCLFATASLAFINSPAMAADMLSVGVGGYMQQWFGYANRADDGEDGGWAAQADSEVHFRGSLESDMGLNFTVHVELEGDRGSNAIDESYARVSGEFGQIEFGARDHVMVRMHSGISDVGIGLTSGDTQKWVPGTYLETAGHAIGNARKLNYISPRVSGLQVGVSYAPDDAAQDANTGAPTTNDNAGWGAGLNFQQEIGGGSFTFSLGHRSGDTAGTELELKSGMDSGTRITVGQLKMHEDAIEAYEAARDLTPGEDGIDALEGANDSERAAALANLQNAAVTGANAIANALDQTVTRGDAATYTNVGVGVGMGAFKFNVAYATVDGGAYMAVANPIVRNQNDGVASTDCSDSNVHCFDHDSEDSTDAVVETDSQNDPSNDWARKTVAKDTSKDYDVWGVSVSYTDGPMSISLGHMSHEADNGGERTATMLSASYALAPGVAWKSSVFGVEDTTGHKNVTGGMNEGTGFVTGIALSF